MCNAELNAMHSSGDRRRAAPLLGRVSPGPWLALLGTGLCACAANRWNCSDFTPPERAHVTTGSLRIRYTGGVGTLDRDDVPMFVRQEMDRSVYVSGCVDDAEGMWDIDVVTSVPEAVELPADFGDGESAPRVVVRLYRYEDDRYVQPALFEDGQEVEVTGTLAALDTQAGSLVFDAALSKPCIGDCSSVRSHVEVDADLSW
jgi:hypothetical protein